MSDPTSFTSTTPRFGLPFLFSGQAQEEVSVNEAHALADMLLHPCIAGELAAPPASPSAGDCWLVGAGATGDWQGHDGSLACLQAGNWLFAAPRNGLCVFDESSGRIRFYRDGWQVAAPVSEPQGGSVVDSEARSAVSQLVAALVSAGILATA